MRNKPFGRPLRVRIAPFTTASLLTLDETDIIVEDNLFIRYLLFGRRRKLLEAEKDIL